MFKVIICGSRNFNDYELLKDSCNYFLSSIKDEIIIISGCARGADTLGEIYAEEKGYSVLRFPADWKKYGKRAGYLRNLQMSEVADGVIAFFDPDSDNIGTKMMIEISKKEENTIQDSKQRGRGLISSFIFFAFKTLYML